MNHRKIGFKVKRQRLLMKITVKEMADILNISRVTYYKKEEAKKPFTLDELAVLAHTFGISVCDILSDIETT